jgi:predicted nucleic acid-binding protein
VNGVIVVDASVALKWVIEEPGSNAAAELQGQTLLAPDLWLIECGNALWARVRRNALGVADAVALFARLEGAPVRTMPSQLYVAEALQLAADLNHPVYDCLYLAAALREDGVVITADSRFYEATRGSLLAERVKAL